MLKFYYIYRKRKKRDNLTEEQTFDSSAMADMAFLLLIFFIVTSSFILRQGIFFSLPSKSAGAAVSANKMLNLYPKNKGFILEGKSFQRGDLLTRLKEIKQESPNLILVINMTGQVKYERLIDALSLAKEVGLKKISLKDHLKNEKK